MEIRAYGKYYLGDAKRRLGVCTDWLVRGCGVPADRVGYLYATSPTMARFGRGDPSVVAGLSGRELGLALFREMRGADAEPPRTRRERTAAGKSPEWWAGWALAHFQWHWCRSFRWIFARTTLSAVVAKHHLYHEMDVSRFLEDFMEELAAVETESNLGRIRRAAGLSQSALARLSGVNVRNIQLYEQGVQDIGRAAASSVAALAHCLSCSVEDLLE